MKNILGLDLGTNSIGWALVEQDFEKKEGKILGMGSRIIPMGATIMGDFEKGNSVSQTAKRTQYRSTRKLYERHHQRRERLHRVLNVLGFLPEHYSNDIDFEKRIGKFKDETETKLVWKKNGKKENGKDKYEFLFQDLFKEMIEEFKKNQPQLFYTKANGEETKIPYDWAIYYLRKKALTQKIEKEELAWLILNFNQKRGYYQLRGEEEEENSNKLVEFHSLKVVDVKPEIKYNLVLENGETYYRTNEISLLDWKDTYQDFIVTKYWDNTGKEKQSFILKEDIGFLKNKKTKSSKKKANETVEEQSIKIIEVKEVKQEKIWYSVVLENGWIYRRESAIDLSDWKDKMREFIVTTDLNDDGSIKTDSEGKESRSFRAPKEDDWTLIKKKTEQDIDKSNKTVGEYIYDILLQNPTQKINGKLVRTIERKFYRSELKQILEKQIELQPELFTDDLYNDCVRELYRSNEAHQLLLSKRDFVHLFLDDIIFYQRPLKSQKSSIGNCVLEYRLHKINKKDDKGNPIKNVFEKDENGKDIEVKEYLKAIPKSNPYYQEFRIWQWMYNLKIYRQEDDKDVTADFVKSINDWENLFDFLMTKKEVNHKDILNYFIVPNVKKKFPDAKPKVLKEETAKEIAKYRWNYVYDAEKDESKTYPMNETAYEIRRRLENVENLPDNFLTREIEQKLWHIIYSVNDKTEFEKALKSFANKHNLDETSFVDNFRKFPPFKSDYGSFSEKAIKKLLPLMRLGKYWKWEAVDEKTQNRINKIITGEYDEEIKNRVREKAIHLTEQNHFQGLQLWLAQYIIYDRHSEASDSSQWKSIADLEKYLEEFKQHSLRNPIVEQVVTETLRVVKDIWKHYGKGAENFFDEIHIELGREMKNTAEDRKRITNQVTENENTNLRIKKMLIEFANDDYFKNQENYKDEKGETPAYYKKGANPVRAYSSTQQEILKIYEDGVLSSVSKEELEKETGLTEIKDGKTKKITYKDISQKSAPTQAQIQKYKLWLEQKYQSPYTGQMIPLSKLFTPAYEIEHIIPQSRYFDDSFSNKVICEAEVNSLKDRQLGLEFIKNHHGKKVTTSSGTVEIFSEKAYTTFVKEHYDKNRSKRNKLLLDEIPDKMIERQLNDTRYISKFITSVLSNIVRADKDDDGVNSKNIIPCSGKITSILKQDWGLNDVWNELILPRFKRMNELTKTEVFTAKNKEGHTIPAIPLELSKGFQKKRIDHRHHAMDALVIACATRDHVNLLNNQSAKSENSRYDLQNKLRNQEKWQDKNGNKRDKFTDFKKPWDNFTVNAKNELEKIVVSFKQNLRVINKATNYYEKIENGKKVEAEQKGMNWAIRKSLHKEFVYAKVDLPWVKVGKKELLTAIRKPLDVSFDEKKIKTSITDIGIQKILLAHLEKYKGRKDDNGKDIAPETLAFMPEGIEGMNKNIIELNNNKFHQPIFKVRVFEKGTGRFAVGQSGNKKDKYVEADKGTNLFFVVYERKDTKTRMFDTVPLNEVIEHQKLQIETNIDKSIRTDVPIKNTLINNNNEVEVKYLFHLSPNDLVYVPTAEEQENSSRIDFDNLTKEQKGRIYKFTDGSGVMANFIPVNTSNVLFNMNKDKQKKAFGKELFSIQNEIGVGSQGSKNENAITGEQIKSVCIKLKVDRLGNITKA